MVMPGDNVEMAVELITPIAMEKGLRFAIREGGRTVGAGTVTEIIDVAATKEQPCATSSPCSAPDCKRRNYIDDQEQEEDHGAAGAEQVLPLLPQAHGAQGDEVRTHD